MRDGIPSRNNDEKATNFARPVKRDGDGLDNNPRLVSPREIPARLRNSTANARTVWPTESRGAATIRIVWCWRTPTGYRVREPSRGPKMQERNRPSLAATAIMANNSLSDCQALRRPAQNCRTPRVHCAYTGCRENTDSSR